MTAKALKEPSRKGNQLPCFSRVLLGLQEIGLKPVVSIGLKPIDTIVSNQAWNNQPCRSSYQNFSLLQHKTPDLCFILLSLKPSVQVLFAASFSASLHPGVLPTLLHPLQVLSNESLARWPEKSLNKSNSPLHKLLIFLQQIYDRGRYEGGGERLSRAVRLHSTTQTRTNFFFFRQPFWKGIFPANFLAIIE